MFALLNCCALTLTIIVSHGVMPSSTCNEDQSVLAAEGSTSSAFGSLGALHCLQAPRCECDVNDHALKRRGDISMDSVQIMKPTLAKFTKLQRPQRQSRTTC
jgi:hypothetical protein